MKRSRPRSAGSASGQPKDRRALGRRGEALALGHLERLGWRIVARNVHLREAEVDIIGLDGETLCFVEVRLRASARFGSPEESFDARKQARLLRAARILLARGGLPRFLALRFDLIAIDASQTPHVLRHHRDVIQP